MSRLPEQRAWDTFSGGYNRSELKLFRVENMCVDGMADIIGLNRRGVTFWLESKALDKWPERHTTFPLKDVFEPGQIPFLRQWKWWKGHAYVLLRIDTEFILLDPDLELKEMTAVALLSSAIISGKLAIYSHLERLE